MPRTGRRASPAESIHWIGVAAIALGLLVYGFVLYQALTAGGLTETGTRAACADAAIGRPDAQYRIGENVVVAHTFLPPSAVCRWSGGTEAMIMPVTAWSWSGPALTVLGIVSVVVGRIVRARTATR